MEIREGTPVEVTTAGGDQVWMIAVTGVVPGRDMPVVWVARADEYKRKGLGAHRIPWPAQFVRTPTGTGR
ncbi:hypothetical protein ABFW00_08080 [Mycobacteroides abscessus]|uniref:hypothetical protein n=1 Tax=Mycobacteroides abscessus TaxID=36809 RepID=UPI00119E4B90|nr:hypothetical protein [Mycobacteroides abscessus]